MIGAGLSLDQAPPLSVPLRFFVTAPLFGLLAGLSLLILPPAAFASRWSAGSLAFTHLMILGFLLTTMMGALFQVLPVVAGATIKHVQLISAWLLPLHIIGTLGLCYGFLSFNWTRALPPLIFLVVSLLIFVAVTYQGLSKAKAASESVTGLRLSVASLLLTLLLGVLLIGGTIGVPLPFFRPGLTNLHLTQGLVGTIFLLIASVSYQVIPMFYVTAPYPGWLRRYLAPITFLLVIFNLVMTTISEIGGVPVLSTSRYLLFIPIAIYCLTTWQLIGQRRRKTFDASFLFWRTALVLTSASLIFWVLDLEFWAGTLAILGTSAVLFGMLTKIIPFLIWFHLQSKATPGFKVPHMKSMISDQLAQLAYALFILASGSLLLFIVDPRRYQYWTGLFVCGLFSFFFGLILRCIRIYRKTRQQLPIESR